MKPTRHRGALVLALSLTLLALERPAAGQCAEPDAGGATTARLEVTGLPLLNQPAPAFDAVTTDGRRRLSDYAGKWLVLFSHPADFTPVCTTEFIGFAKAHERFRALGAELLGLSIDSKFAHIAWKRTIREKFGVEIPFPIIEDLSMRVASAYGMIHPGASDTSAVRATFVIDPEGVLRAMLYYPMTNGRSVEEILRLVEALKTSDAHGVATPEGWRPGDDVIVPPPATSAAADERAKSGTECTDWFYCTRPLAAKPRVAEEEHGAIFSDELEPYECGNIERLHTQGGVFLASQPAPADIEQAQKGGVKTVINQRHASELDFDERALVEKLGMTYENPAWNGTDELTDELLDRTRALLATAERPILLHCSSANRVGAAWLAYRVLDEEAEVDEALEEAKTVGLRSPAYRDRVLEYIELRRDAQARSALDPATRSALFEALEDERRAQDFYAAVIARFGDRRPFSMIVEAEKRHESHLLDLLSRYGVEAPSKRAVLDLRVPDTLAAACRAAVESERANIALYDRLLPGIDEADVRGTMEILRAASAERHLPAFERCAGRP